MQGFKRLNVIQSTVCDCAFRSNENMLVCAPTGAGKTNIALLTVLHEVGKHIRGKLRLGMDDDEKNGHIWGKSLI